MLCRSGAAVPGRKNRPARNSAAPGSVGGVRVSVTCAPLIALAPSNLGAGAGAHPFAGPVRVRTGRPDPRQTLRATPAYTGTMPSACTATSSGSGRHPVTGMTPGPTSSRPSKKRENSLRERG